MNKLTLVKRFLHLKQPQRTFFNFFKKNETKIDIINKEPTHDDILDYYRQNPHRIQQKEISEVQKEYLKLRKEREAKEREKDKIKKEIEEASKRTKREHEITIETFDHRSIMINNINIIPTNDFKHIEEFVYYFNDICYNHRRLDEENVLKMIKGFQIYADRLNSEQIDSPVFSYFLDNLRKNIKIFKDENTILEILKFLDLYCVDYPELWAKIEAQKVKHIRYWSLNIIIEMIGSFSNQNQGSDSLYDKVEQRIIYYMDNLTSEELLTILKSFFNVRRGTKVFIEKLLNRLIAHLDDEEFSFELDYLLNVALSLDYLDENYVVLKQKLYQMIEERILEQKEELDLTYATAFARCFGIEFGSEKLFYVLETMASNDIKNLNLEEYKLYIEGFVFSYRISDTNLDTVLEKFSTYRAHLTPAFLAKLSKSLYILEKEKHKVMKEIESILIGILKNNPDWVTKEDAYQMAFCYSLTRNGSREFYKILEENLANNLSEWMRDISFIQKLHSIYEKSGLCTYQFLSCLKELKGK